MSYSLVYSSHQSWSWKLFSIYQESSGNGGLLSPFFSPLLCNSNKIIKPFTWKLAEFWFLYCFTLEDVATKSFCNGFKSRETKLKALQSGCKVTLLQRKIYLIGIIFVFQYLMNEILRRLLIDIVTYLDISTVCTSLENSNDKLSSLRSIILTVKDCDK